MTNPVPAIEPAPLRPAAASRWAVPALPFATWLLVQLGCLAVSLLDVPLAAQVRPGESLAVQILLAGQVAAAALLAPSLLRTWPAATLAAAAAWPTLLLAGAAQSIPISQTAAAGAAVTLWIAALTSLNALSNSPALHRTISAFATLLSVGGAILSYFAIEFASDPTAEPTTPSGMQFTPLLTAWNLAGREPVWSNMVPATLVFLICCVPWRKLRRY